MNETQELIDQLQEIQTQMLDLVGQLRDIANQDASHSGWAMSYIIPHLETVITREHEWMSRDQNIDDWIDMVRAEDESYQGNRDENGNPTDELTDDDGYVLCPNCRQKLSDCHCPDIED